MMGTEYPCGCRQSGGAWYLCKDHEREHEVALETADVTISKFGKAKEIIRKKMKELLKK